MTERLTEKATGPGAWVVPTISETEDDAFVLPSTLDHQPPFTIPGVDDRLVPSPIDIPSGDDFMLTLPFSISDDFVAPQRPGEHWDDMWL